MAARERERRSGSQASPSLPSPIRRPHHRGMGSSPPSPGGFVPDLSTCRLMSVNEKRELVRELSKCQRSAPEQLQEWTRREILEVLCAELGKERKEKTFSSRPKHKLLDILFKVVNGESSYPRKHKKRKSNPEPNAINLLPPFKRQRKNESSSLLPVTASTLVLTGESALTNNAHLCQNSACRATLNPEDKFCKRCSCCICFKYDDNKDPTLWLFCNSDPPLQEDSCGFSCHLECALEDERSGILQSGQSKKLGGDYYCTHCGKQNDLLGCWKKQLLVAKNARRLDVLCLRIFLSHKILICTKRYLVLHEIVDTAMKKLEAEVGPITGVQDMGRGLVGRLAVGAEVQRLCICAIEALQSLFSGSLTADLQIERSCMAHCNEPTSKSKNIKNGDVGETKVDGLEISPGVSAAVFDEEQEISRSDGWAAILRKSSSLMVYNRGSLKQNLQMVFTGSDTAAHAHTGNMLVDPPEYSSNSLLHILPRGTINHKGVVEKSFKEAKSGDHVPQNGSLKAETDPESSSCKTTLGRFEDSGDKDETSESNTAAQTSLPRHPSNLILNDRGTLQNLHADAARLENASDVPNENELAGPHLCFGSLLHITENEIKSGNGISATGCKSKTDYHIPHTGPSKPETEPGSSSNKSLSGKSEEISGKDGRSEASYEYCVKMIRRLECEGHIEANFRVKFLTWFSLRATPHERRVVSAFVDTLMDDPVSLAGQLDHTFSDAIYSRSRIGCHLVSA